MTKDKGVKAGDDTVVSDDASIEEDDWGGEEVYRWADLADDEMRVKTKALGANASGLVPVGTEMTVKIDSYSPAWMQPVDLEQAQKRQAYLKAHRKQTS